MATIMIRNYSVIVDDEDVERVTAINWNPVPNQKNRSRVYFQRQYFAGGVRKYLHLHRFLIGASDPKILVDHADGNCLNNTKANLRLATTTQNNGNSKRSKRNSTGFKGVDWKADHKKWRACLTYAGKFHFLGYHDSPESAHEAYCAKAKELFGEFARFE